MLSPEYILNILKAECGYHDGDSILVGVSGGADSVALLHLLHEAKLPVAAAHVNYRLRGEESDGDEKFVSDLCTQLNVPLYTRRTHEKELNSIDNNLQAAARKFRYDFFHEIISKESLQWIAVAHHAKDQLETVLMNFLRGSGINGLSGMNMKNGNIIRPFLKMDDREFYAYLADQQIQFRTDSSNLTDEYFRNKLRHHVLPFLTNNDERLGKGWQHSVDQLAETSSVLHELLDLWAEQVTVPDSKVEQYNVATLNKFPRPHVLLNYLLQRRNVNIRFTKEEYADLLTKQRGTKFKDGHTTLLYDGPTLILAYAEVPKEANRLNVEDPPEGWKCEIIEYFDITKEKKYEGYEAVIDKESITDILTIRTWKEGDRIYPLGLNGSKKVSDVLTEMKIPLTEKANYPVVESKGEIVWIPGYRIAEKYKVSQNTLEAVYIKWNR